MKLDLCSRCHGFLPAEADTCPHCAATKSRMVKLLGGALGGGAIAFTLMACYGAAPCQEGPNCRPAAPAPDTSGMPGPSAGPDGGK